MRPLLMVGHRHGRVLSESWYFFSESAVLVMAREQDGLLPQEIVAYLCIQQYRECPTKMSQLAMCGHLTMGFLPPLMRYLKRRISYYLWGHGMSVPHFSATGALRPITRMNVHFVDCSSLVARIDAANCLAPLAHMPFFFMSVTFLFLMRNAAVIFPAVVCLASLPAATSRWSPTPSSSSPSRA